MIYFDKLTIKQKILMPSIVIIAGFAVIMLVYQQGEHLREQGEQKKQHIVDFNSSAIELSMQLMHIEHDYKDFLLDHNARFKDQFAEDMAEIDMLIGKLEAMAPNADLLADVQKSKKFINDYHDGVNRMVVNKISLGLNETLGLLGGLRKSIHDVEGVLSKYNEVEIANSMLMMRRHEKDFLARMDDKYVTQMGEEQRRFASLLKQSTMPEAAQTNIREKVKLYHNAFLAMVEGNKQAQQDITESNHAIRLYEPVLAALVDGSKVILAGAHKQLAEDGKQISNIFNFTMSIIGIIIVLLVLLVNRMMDNLSVLIGKVQESSIKVASSVTQIAASTQEQEATASENTATTSEVAASVKEIAATSKHLGQTTEEVAQLAHGTAESAVDGQALLTALDATMVHMSRASTGITNKLAALSEKAGNIGNMVTTINKVADQTNLLSLNAAIEAEKAGDYGRGFAVVATEIRRLADQTAVSTYDIEQMVGEMQSAVSAGVMSMDKFSEEIYSSVKEAKNAGLQLEKIIEQVQALAPHIESVNEGLQAQIEGTDQIDEAMMNLSEAAQQTSEMIRQSNNAIAELNDAARGLQEGAAIFKVNA